MARLHSRWPILQPNTMADEVMAERISRKPDELAEQCARVAVAIETEPNWPPAPLAPTAMDFNGHAENLLRQLSVIGKLESQLHDARQAIKPLIRNARADMTKADQATSMLYGPEGAQKMDFGIAPKKTRPHTIKPKQVVISSIIGGAHRDSILLYWAKVGTAVYEVQWFTGADLKQMAGSATVTASELDVQGLERGKQYWFRVRAVRANQPGLWSDQATRVVNI